MMNAPAVATAIPTGTDGCDTLSFDEEGQYSAADHGAPNAHRQRGDGTTRISAGHDGLGQKPTIVPKPIQTRTSFANCWKKSGFSMLAAGQKTDWQSAARRATGCETVVSTTSTIIIDHYSQPTTGSLIFGRDAELTAIRVCWPFRRLVGIPLHLFQHQLDGRIQLGIFSLGQASRVINHRRYPVRHRAPRCPTYRPSRSRQTWVR